MTIEEDYFVWLCDSITDEDFNPSRYQSLLRKLYHTTFRWVMENDENRASDGLDLRDVFAMTTNKDIYGVRMSLSFPCSVLEVMVALAKRCENQIMEDLLVGPRVGRWFLVMLTSLGLSREYDDLYDENYTDYIIDGFLDRKYERDGDGGLFRVVGTQVDLRDLEIWYQMNLYLCNLEAG